MEVCAVENRKDYGSPSDVLKSGGDFAYWASLAMNSAGDGFLPRNSFHCKSRDSGSLPRHASSIASCRAASISLHGRYILFDG